MESQLIPQQILDELFPEDNDLGEESMFESSAKRSTDGDFQRIESLSSPLTTSTS